MQAILDNTPTGIAVMESVREPDSVARKGRIVDFRFTHLNYDAGRITRRDRHQLIGQRYSEAWPEARTNGVLDWHIRVAETGEPAKINGVNLVVDGYDGWFNIRIRPFGDGVIATFIDVTALKQAELANQRQAALLRSVLDSSANPIIAFSAVRDGATNKIVDFRYEAQNEANRRNVNRTDEEVIGHTMLEHFPQVVSAGLFDRYVTVVETGESVRFEQECNYDGLNGWFEISVAKWGDGIVLTLVDITDSRAYQQQIERANRDLLYANDNLRQFSYVASHDLQEPLRKIMAFGDLLQEQFGPQLGNVGQNMIGRMQSAAGRMSNLLKDVLAYSRISTHSEPFCAVSLNELMTDLRDELQHELQKTNAHLIINDLPSVPGNYVQLHQLFVNLLLNALKFRKNDRPLTITITSQAVAGAALPAALNPTMTYYEICVADNGIGFDNKYADQIFRVFQRLHNRQHYDGTGVGLAICKRVVENHHGCIIATAQPSEGAIFRVYLPKHE
ncbi:hypothetical protein AWR27_02665 [Spirosoma montaniterrae]|uniref:histidine kinase n=1 Tax=Spirosoma montaniterrae TaxID=1178516 RepID=A0A1P9WSH2_9BACT|nr:hypothetical protein AWR27_02665 [Spirosoma montaniterrae]